MSFSHSAPAVQTWAGGGQDRVSELPSCVPSSSGFFFFFSFSLLKPPLWISLLPGRAVQTWACWWAREGTTATCSGSSPQCASPWRTQVLHSLHLHACSNVPYSADATILGRFVSFPWDQMQSSRTEMYGLCTLLCAVLGTVYFSA